MTAEMVTGGWGREEGDLVRNSTLSTLCFPKNRVSDGANLTIRVIFFNDCYYLFFGR